MTIKEAIIQVKRKHKESVVEYNYQSQTWECLISRFNNNKVIGVGLTIGQAWKDAQKRMKK